MKPSTVPMPPDIAALPRDGRGLPIPVTVLVDGNGTAHFSGTDGEARHRMIKEDRCHLTGRKLTRGRWFIGGPLPAFHAQGAFLDGPSTDEASAYAVQVCPYIAARNYGRLINDGTIKKAGAAVQGVVLSVTSGDIPDRPELFVRVMTVGQRLVPSDTGDVLFVTSKPYRKVEFWRHGAMLDFDEGVALSVSTSDGMLTEAAVRAACGRR